MVSVLGALPGALGAALFGGLLWWSALAVGFVIGGARSHGYAPWWWGPVTFSAFMFPIGAGVRGAYVLSRAFTATRKRPALTAIDVGSAGLGWLLGVVGAVLTLPFILILNFSA